ncbi:hypothetical protein KC338_g3600 [Hortaea werneckii]|nr:hypothetical protein KC338_g3600 [Hortaea werneckii]
MADATVAPPELTRFIGNCCPDHGCRTSSRLRTTTVVVVVVFFYGTSHPTALFFAADFAPWATDIFFLIVDRTSVYSAGLSATFNKLFFGTPDWPSVKLRAASVLLTSASTMSTASIHAHYFLFKLYPAPWTTFDVSVTNFLHSTIVIWAVHSLVVHWTSNFSSASSLYRNNFFILHWTANLSSASSLYRHNFFIVHWTANLSSASSLYRNNFFILHWTANFSSASSLYRIDFFILHWTANFSSASSLYRNNFFILHWTANLSSAPALYRIDFFIVHWTANPPSVYHLHPAKLFVVHCAAH